MLHHIYQLMISFVCCEVQRWFLDFYYAWTCGFNLETLKRIWNSYDIIWSDSLNRVGGSWLTDTLNTAFFKHSGNTISDNFVLHFSTASLPLIDWFFVCSLSDGGETEMVKKKRKMLFLSEICSDGVSLYSVASHKCTNKHTLTLRVECFLAKLSSSLKC